MTSLDSLHVEANGGDGAMSIKRVSNPLDTRDGNCNGLLNGELSSLQERGSAWRRRLNVRQLTAKTRKRDVLPAFCKPIMVMSISVALSSGQPEHPHYKAITEVYQVASVTMLFPPMRSQAGQHFGRTGQDRTGQYMTGQYKTGHTRTGARASHRCF